MGAASSTDLRPEEIDELATLTKYEPKEVRTLYKRFRRLDRTNKGTISIDDLCMIPEIIMNPLSQRLIQLFERDSEDRINFRSFVTGLSVFNETATNEIKATNLFKVFDVDQDGYISDNDLKKILEYMTGTSLSQTAAETVIHTTLQQADIDGDGVISLQDFLISMSSYPFESFIVPVKKTSREQYFLQLDEGTTTNTTNTTTTTPPSNTQ